MHFGEAVVLGACAHPDGSLELELHAVCPASNFERLNVLVGTTRVAVPLDRPERGALRSFKVTVQADAPLSQRDKMPIEFFFPGEQAGVRGGNVDFWRTELNQTSKIGSIGRVSRWSNVLVERPAS